ncbi:hypothetical protein MesoLj113b_64630 [Mesorhizobium sp. 113-3-3]|nr:hypothetical protein MesoLj113b_64630 [Mesorhizobium sp. 113-3-3]BCG90798.1 hypothetical protein MesoLj113c_69080 [Mesorhizobium sp. 113-3-9]
MYTLRMGGGGTTAGMPVRRFVCVISGESAEAFYDALQSMVATDSISASDDPEAAAGAAWSEAAVNRLRKLG